MRDARSIHRITPLLGGLLIACGGAAASAPRTEPASEPVVASESVDRVARDDVEGLVRDLSVPERREAAVAALAAHYQRALGDAEQDRDAEGPRAIVARSAGALVEAYLAEPDRAVGRELLRLVVAMGAPNAWPAYRRALAWRHEETEEHTLVAVEGMALGWVDDVPAESRAEAVAEALLRIDGARGIDNWMRIGLLRTLGTIDDPTSRQALATIAERIDENQNLLINRLALEKLANQADSTMMRALFLSGAGRPDLRMNDLAAEGLILIGRPALRPALELLAGRNAEANALARSYIDSVRERNAEVAAQMSAEDIVADEACYVLGQLGFAQALDPLLAETQHASSQRRFSAAVSLASLSGLTDAQDRRVRDAMHRVYGRSEPPQQLQILVAIQHRHDAGHLPFLLRIAGDRTAPIPDHRVLAARAYALLANERESQALRRIIRVEPADDPQGRATYLRENLPTLEAATRCNEDVACWRGLLGDEDSAAVRKALYMLARLDAPWADSREALLPLIGHDDAEVRSDALYVIDHLSIDGDRTVIDRIDALRAAEEGRSSWNQINGLAMPVRGRQWLRINSN